jgi:cytochrome c556
VIGFNQLLSRHRAAGIFLAISVVGGSFMAFGQDNGIAPKDVIFARKIVMSTIANSMYEIDGMLQTGKIDLPKARHHADAISGLLTAFPHLFPPATNTWTPNAPRDPATDTFTDPSLWTVFTFFYKEAQRAADYAHKASRAENEAEFRKNATELRLACDTCHATFQKNN